MAFDIDLRDNGAGTFDLSLAAGGGPITATATITDGADTVAAAGTVIVPTFTGSAAITDGADTVAASGTFAPLPVTATATITDGADTVAATAVIPGSGSASGGGSGVPPMEYALTLIQQQPARPWHSTPMGICTLAVGAGMVR